MIELSDGALLVLAALVLASADMLVFLLIDVILVGKWLSLAKSSRPNFWKPRFAVLDREALLYRE